MAKGSGVYATIGLSGLASESGGFQLAQERLVRFELPADFDVNHSEILRRDSELIMQLAGDNADSIACMQNAAVRNDFGEATRIANEIGLTEDRFNAEGGGFWWYIAGAAVVIGIYAATSGSGTHEPVPNPDPPPPETVIADAGPG